jgi:hypothetical protein
MPLCPKAATPKESRGQVNRMSGRNRVGAVSPAPLLMAMATIAAIEFAP